MMEISSEQLGRLAKSTIAKGSVYRLKLTEAEGVKPKNAGDDSRNKFFIVMGTAEDGTVIGFVLINSSVNAHIPQRLRSLHYLLRAEDYPFLIVDRYACCGELKTIDTTEFFSRFKDDAVGQISEEHLDVISSLLASSDDVPAALLRSFDII